MRTEPGDKPLFVLHGVIKTPPMSSEARLTVGYNLRRVQQGENLSMPESRPMPEIGANCHELRVGDPEQRVDWRVIYCIDDSAILVLEVFPKASRETPDKIKRICRERLRRFLDAKEGNGSHE